MKVAIERDELLRGINAVLDVVPAKTALPVLSNILMECDENGCVGLKATDLDLSVICGLSGKVEVAGATTVPARKFAEIVRELPEESVVVTSEEGRVTLEREGGAKGTYALMSVPAEDFPDLPSEIDGPELVFEASEEGTGGGDLLREMIVKTSFAVSRDETRPVLNGVLWQIGEGRMTMVATDGARLVKHSKPFPKAEASGKDTEAIVPTRALQHLVKLLSGGAMLGCVQFGRNHLRFDLSAGEEAEGAEIQLFSRLIEGPYVDYEQVIPKGNDKELKVSNELLAPAVRRVSVLSSSQTHQVRLRLQSDAIELSATSQEIGGEARETMEASYAEEEMSIGYNSAYLQEILRRIDTGEVVFSLDTAVTAGIIRPS
ncbi:MAG: DNA polymerase III subunit beta, partial [Candidatus Latescibacteria bacterium]|nr:DNA polymerase III subunit beta [Candidatus Latescibacterota bacterium]